MLTNILADMDGTLRVFTGDDDVAVCACVLDMFAKIRAGVDDISLDLADTC